MDHNYEAGVMSVLADLVSRNLVQRKLRTVPTCQKCQTVLAAAELESRNEAEAQSCLVSFPLGESASKVVREKLKVSAGDEVSRKRDTEIERHNKIREMRSERREKKRNED